MSEETNAPIVEAPVTEAPQEEQVDINQLMQFAFQDEMPATPEPEAPIVENTNVAPTVEAPVVAAIPTEEAIDDNVYLKQNFNVEDRDTLKAILQEHAQLKAAASTPAEYKYASDEAKKIANAINSGDWKTLKSYVEAQELSVDGMTPEQQLKTFIKLQNPLFDQELIEDEFSSNYVVDETDEKYFENPLQLRKDKLRMEQRKINDLQNAQRYFAEYKTKAQLPDIKVETPPVDEAYEQYKASTAKNADLVDKVIIPSIKSLKETDLAMNFKVNDANNQMDFDLSIVPEKSDFDESVNKAADFGQWIEDAFWGEDGSFKANKVARAILLEKNFDKYAQSIARQAVNAERRRLLDTNTPTPVIQRDFTQPSNTEAEEFHKIYKQAMSV